jgi:hypothetical protein
MERKYTVPSTIRHTVKEIIIETFVSLLTLSKPKKGNADLRSKHRNRETETGSIFNNRIPILLFPPATLFRDSFAR